MLITSWERRFLFLFVKPAIMWLDHCLWTMPMPWLMGFVQPIIWTLNIYASIPDGGLPIVTTGTHVLGLGLYNLL